MIKRFAWSVSHAQVVRAVQNWQPAKGKNDFIASKIYWVANLGGFFVETSTILTICYAFSNKRKKYVILLNVINDGMVAGRD